MLKEWLYQSISTVLLAPHHVYYLFVNWWLCGNGLLVWHSDRSVGARDELATFLLGQ